MSLSDMLHFKLVNENDTVYFTFKEPLYRVKILRGGLIGGCKLTSCGKTKRFLKVSLPFPPLLHGPKPACKMYSRNTIRGIPHGRGIHKESKRSMGDLRDQCKLLTKKRKREEEVSELYKEIYRLQQTIVDMRAHIEQWKTVIHHNRRIGKWSVSNPM